VTRYGRIHTGRGVSRNGHGLLQRAHSRGLVHSLRPIAARVRMVATLALAKTSAAKLASNVLTVEEQPWRPIRLVANINGRRKTDLPMPTLRNKTFAFADDLGIEVLWRVPSEQLHPDATIPKASLPLRSRSRARRYVRDDTRLSASESQSEASDLVWLEQT